jgi:hypothetical protein
VERGKVWSYFLSVLIYVVQEIIRKERRERKYLQPPTSTRRINTNNLNNTTRPNGHVDLLERLSRDGVPRRRILVDCSR